MKRIYSCLALLWLLCLLAGCNSDSGKQPNEAITDPKTVYAQALTALEAEPALEIKLGIEKTVTQGSSNLTEYSQQTVTMTGRGTDKLAVAVKETMEIGSESCNFTEYYKDGSGYVSVNGVGFTVPMTAEAYLARLVPIALLEPSLYGTVESQSNSPAMKLQFSDATALEGWLSAPGAVLLSASGTANINSLGHLTDSTYQASYTAGEAQIALTVTVHINAYTDPAADPPTDTVKFQTIDNLDVPKLLERACSLLLTAEELSASVDTELACDAGQRRRTEAFAVSMSGSGTELIAQVDTEISVADGEGSKPVTRKQQETYRSGLYNIAQEGMAPVQKTDVTAADMRRHCRSILTQYILLPGHIASASLTQNADGLLLEFTGNSVCSKLLRMAAAEALYGSQEELEAVASDYATGHTRTHLLLDANTGFLISSGIEHAGTYTINDTAYGLTVLSEQTLSLK